MKKGLGNCKTEKKWCVSEEHEFENAVLDIWLVFTSNKYIFAILLEGIICDIAIFADI